MVEVFGRGAAGVQVISNFVHEIRAQGVLDKAVTIYRGWSKLEKMSYTAIMLLEVKGLGTSHSVRISQEK